MSQIERDIPEEQRQGTEGGEMMAYDRAEELAEQFEDIQTATIGDGLLRGTVEAIEASPNNAAISIEVDLPAEEDPEQFFLDKPKSWSREYEFVRWVEDHGYTSGDFQGMIEKNVRVEVERDNGDYELVIPERVTDKSRRLKPVVKNWVIERLRAGVQSQTLVPLALVFSAVFAGNFVAAGLFFTGDVLGFSFISTIMGFGVGLVGLIVGTIVNDELDNGR